MTPSELHKYMTDFLHVTLFFAFDVNIVPEFQYLRITPLVSCGVYVEPSGYRNMPEL